ncbi:hypothetical protein [Moritella sp.]|uniref:hypothetical protein n=1 Tax=Moritella sp. TaxID=78556 RepID=UPI0025F03883|nr:hypothetical protein [Moritella sp.]MCJ8351153.1 hypothetical protein [Moritella sp.]
MQVINVNVRALLAHQQDEHVYIYEISASAGVGLLAEVEERPKTISFEPYWLRNEIGVCLIMYF